MAYMIANSTGNFGTAATWDTVTNTPTMHAATNVTVSTVARFTATFTAPNTTNASTGAAFYMTDLTFVSMVLTLQEDIGGTGVWLDTAATVTVDPTTLATNTNYFYLRFPTPYVFATTGANRYRFKVACVSGSGTLAADTGGTLYAFWGTDNRNAVPVDGDYVRVIGVNGVPITVTVDGTRACGNGGTLYSTSLTSRLGNDFGVVISDGSTLAWNRVSNSQLTCRGNLFVDNTAIWDMGTVASPIPAGVTASLIFLCSAATDYGAFVPNNAIAYLQGAPKTYTKTNYVSGVGTAASPLVVLDPVDWAVGDEVAVSPGTNSATNYNEVEYKFIKTKNSSTSYVLSDTSGGAEAAFTYTHTTNSLVINISNNVVIKGSSTTLAMGGPYFAAQTVTGNVDVDWVRFENLGTTSTGYIGCLNRIAIDNSIAYGGGLSRYGFYFPGLTTPSTKTNLISVRSTFSSTTTAAGGIALSASKNLTFTDCIAIGRPTNHGWSIVSSFGCTFNNCQAIAACTSSLSGGFLIATSGNLTFNNCEGQANRYADVHLAGATDMSFVNFQSATKALTPTSVSPQADTYNTATFTNSNFAATNLVNANNIVLTLAGTEIRFHAYNDSVTDHRWYTSNGIGRSTGAGLTDTTIKTSNSLGLRMEPQTEDGFNWRFKVLAKAGAAVSALGFLQLNSAFTTDVDTVCTASLVLPGSTTIDATQTMSKLTNGWQVFNLAAVYSGSVDGYAVVTINSTNINAVAGAYVYADDIFNGTNNITAIDVWDEGKPSEIMFEQLGDAAAVWAVPTSTLTTTGTTGKLLTKLLTVGKFLALK
jgi:hypothetical protein